MNQPLTQDSQPGEPTAPAVDRPDALPIDQPDSLSLEAELRREAERIERLLEDVHALAGQPVWQRVEELVQRLVRLYGAGLTRLMGHVRELGHLDPALTTRLAGDELLASLLLLHDLHPWPVAERVARALDDAREQLQSHIGPFTLLGVEGQVVKLRLESLASVGVSRVLSVEALLVRALQDAAPEITQVAVEGLQRPATAQVGAGLYQIDLRKSRESHPHSRPVAKGVP